jgi:GDP-4-dehydro-6-deoxy-D-mannose reductase
VRSLIIGGTGFVGGALAELCSESGDEVVITGRERPLRLPSGLSFVPLDLESPESIDAALRAARPEHVYHLAGFSSAGRSFAAPEECYRLNVLGTSAVLSSVGRVTPEARLLVMGSAEEYASSAERLSEDSRLEPRSPYGVSRGAMTFMTLAASRRGLDALVARSFNLVGPGQSTRFMCASFADQIARACAEGRRELEVATGDMSLERDLLDVAVGAKALRALMIDGVVGSVTNVCSGHHVPLMGVLEALGRLAGVAVRSRCDPARLRPGEPERIWGDPSRLVGIFGAVPESLEAALAALTHEALARHGVSVS